MQHICIGQILTMIAVKNDVPFFRKRKLNWSGNPCKEIGLQ